MSREVISQSPLANPTDLPLRPNDTIAEFGSTLVVAPHPDDESLGCGGAIALLRQLGYLVRILVISDGTLSHPRSHKYPAPALAALRQQETLCALAELGVEPSSVMFLRLKDGSVPLKNTTEFDEAIARCRAYLAAFAVATRSPPGSPSLLGTDLYGDSRFKSIVTVSRVSDLGLGPSPKR